MEERVFQMVMKVFERCEKGDLKGMTKPSVCVPSAFKDLRKLSTNKTQTILKRVLENEINISDIRREAQSLKKIKDVQLVFMDCVGKIPGMTQLPSCLLYTSPSPRDATLSRMPSSA